MAATHDGRRVTAVYVISVAAELAGVHPQTLRIYERKGLLDPARTGGGSRRYSDGDIERTVAAAPALSGAGATVIWTRHGGHPTSRRRCGRRTALMTTCTASS